MMLAGGLGRHRDQKWVLNTLSKRPTGIVLGAGLKRRGQSGHSLVCGRTLSVKPDQLWYADGCVSG